jgi:hypothetical protein
VIFSESPSSLQLAGVVLVIGALTFATRGTAGTRAGRTRPLSETGPGPVPGSAGPHPVHPRR